MIYLIIPRCEHEVLVVLYLLMLFESANVKAVRRTLMQLSPDEAVTQLSRRNFFFKVFKNFIYFVKTACVVVFCANSSFRFSLKICFNDDCSQYICKY